MEKTKKMLKKEYILNKLIQRAEIINKMNMV